MRFARYTRQLMYRGIHTCFQKDTGAEAEAEAEADDAPDMVGMLVDVIV
jgi:hypothetical protein